MDRSAWNRQTPDEDQAPHEMTTMTDKARHFAVCIRNIEYEESLELRKIYEIVEDAEAHEHRMLRVIDEEGEGYLYPNDWFLPIELPNNIEEALVELSQH